MLFIEWWLVRGFVYWSVLIGISMYAFWRVRASDRGRRGLVRILSVFAFLLGSFLMMVTLGVTGCQAYGVPLCSPDGRRAARITNETDGALGGSTVVQVFAARGFDTGLALVGDYGVTGTGQVRWLDNQNLEIRYDKGFHATRCGDVVRVKVHCIEVLPSAP